MPWHALVTLLFALTLAGCAERMPRMDVAALTTRSFQVFGYATPEPEQTSSYKLTDQNVIDVKSGFSAAFTDGRTLTFGPIDARLRSDGSLAVCGFVSARAPAGKETGMKLFDGTAEFDPFGALQFRPGRLAGANGKFLDMYTDCRRVGLL